MDSNIKNINKLEIETEHRYETLVKALNSEKEKILESLKKMKIEKFVILSFYICFSFIKIKNIFCLFFSSENFNKFKQSVKQTILNLKRTKSEDLKYEKAKMESKKEKIKLLDDEFNASQNDYMEFCKRPFNIVNEVI